MIGGADNQDKCLCAQAVYIGACGLQSVKKIEISITLLSSVFWWGKSIIPFEYFNQSTGVGVSNNSWNFRNGEVGLNKHVLGYRDPFPLNVFSNGHIINWLK